MYFYAFYMFFKILRKLQNNAQKLLSDPMTRHKQSLVAGHHPPTTLEKVCKYAYMQL